MGFELRIVRGGRVVHTRVVGAAGVRIGRAPDNDLVLSDPMVSQHHAVVSTEDGEPTVRDLGSRNGSFVDGTRVAGSAPIGPGMTLGLGPDMLITVARAASVPLLPTPSVLLLEDLASGVCTPVNSDRMPLLGPDGAPAATLLIVADGEVWLGEGVEDRPLDVDEPFEVAGRQLCIRKGDALAGATATPDLDRYPYQLAATLDGATGAEAVLCDLSSGREHRVTAENRAVLLYLLARRFAADRENGTSAPERGWVPDSEMLTGIWGRDARDENKLHVLVHRVRKEVRDAGFDPWFIEKRRRYIRARVTGAEVE